MAVERARALILRKDAINEELSANFSILSSNGCKMDTKLVDEQGFPRADIDVYAVRNARVAILRLQNDLKSVMDDMMRALEDVHSSLPPEQQNGVDEGAKDVNKVDQSGVTSKPFARVNGVAPGSPAASAGLRREDVLLQFGHLTASSFNGSSLQPLVELVSQHENQPLEIKLRRDSQELTFTLTPQNGWGGRGMLGCHIVPYSS